MPMRLIDVYTVSQQKCATVIFLNSFVKHWLILIIFGTQQHEET